MKPSILNVLVITKHAKVGVYIKNSVSGVTSIKEEKR